MREFFYKIEYSKNNKEILLINGKLIHSKFAPEKEGANFFREGKNCILIFGLGIGYHVINIINNNPDSIFIIYEPIIDILKKGKHNVLSNIGKKNTKICFLNDLDDKKIKNFFEENEFLSAGRIFEYANVGYKNLFPRLYFQFIELVNETFKLYLQNIFTESFFQPIWTKNFLYNSIKFSNTPIVLPKAQNLGSNVAVVVGAGPSLIDDLQALKQYRNYITIFSTDTALKTLLKQKIEPDFVVSLDGQFYSIDDYTNSLPKNTLLIIDAVSHHSLSYLTDKLVFTLTENIFNKSILGYFFNQNKIGVKGIKSGGNIGDYVLSIALEFGFKNIFSTGIDFSYPNFQTHCRGTPFHSRLLTMENYFKPSSSILVDLLSKKELKKVIGRTQKTVYTDFILENYALYFNNLANVYEDTNFFISTSQGYNLSNFKSLDLSNILSEYSSKRIYYSSIIKEENTFYIKRESLLKFYEDLLDELYKASQGLKKKLENQGKNNKDWQSLDTLAENILINFPFLNNFIIKTKMMLGRNNETMDTFTIKSQIYQKLLQSIYYIIRILQKTLAKIKKATS